jgi:hypothetical protein
MMEIFMCSVPALKRKGLGPMSKAFPELANYRLAWSEQTMDEGSP